MGLKLGSFRKSLSGASQVFESGAGCERDVRGAGSEELGSFRKSASGFISFGLGPKLGSFRKFRSRACRVFESGGGCEREVRGAGGEELGSFRKVCKWFHFVRIGLEIGFVSQISLARFTGVRKWDWVCFAILACGAFQPIEVIDGAVAPAFRPDLIGLFRGHCMLCARHVGIALRLEDRMRRGLSLKFGGVGW